jgi:hypothetical protein
LEAHRSALSVHRIAQIFRERGVDISVPHLVRTIRRFVDEEERVGDKESPAPRRPASPMAREPHPESAVAQETKPKAPVTYQVSEQPQHQSPGGGFCEAIAACALPGCVESAAVTATTAGSPAKNA